MTLKKTLIATGLMVAVIACVATTVMALDRNPFVIRHELPDTYEVTGVVTNVAGIAVDDARVQVHLPNRPNPRTTMTEGGTYSIALSGDAVKAAKDIQGYLKVSAFLEGKGSGVHFVPLTLPVIGSATIRADIELTRHPDRYNLDRPLTRTRKRR